MKKITFLLSFALISFSISAQNEDQSNENKLDYDKWSIDVGAGLNKAARPFTKGYYSSTPGAWNADLGIRYMFNDKAGLRLKFGVNDISEGDDSPEFNSQYFTGVIEGVANLGSILNFRDWTNTFNLLAHGGAGVGLLNFGDESIKSEVNDYMGVVTAGLTPQVRLGNSIALFGDVSAYGNIRQGLTWDGNSKTTLRGFDGLLVNFSVGLNVYLGKNEKHADWVDTRDMTKMRNDLDSLENRVAKVEDDMLDSDQDGVPDYLDREPNTMNGVTVDSKGVAVDKNGNGIPDEIESSLDSRYAAKDGANNQNQSGAGTIKKLLNDGYVNVYFKFNSDEPETYSLEAINYLVKYMNENPDANAEMIGYADEIGSAEYNQALSERRAKKVHDIIVAAGIDSNRLEFKGNGVDDSVDKSSSGARQIVRRVTFKLK